MALDRARAYSNLPRQGGVDMLRVFSVEAFGYVRSMTYSIRESSRARRTRPSWRMSDPLRVIRRWSRLNPGRLGSLVPDP